MCIFSEFGLVNLGTEYVTSPATTSMQPQQQQQQQQQFRFGTTQPQPRTYFNPYLGQHVPGTLILAVN